ncbi:hypothetical protein [Brevundimonas sp.]|uniref:hypothetical protein n=1 Tax=Brevundimonas sp. TaxID=1871086 RepID=UPI002488BED2|nr:hypothetical protein [Brevundimonas sp.]MDI1281811.1 hypothetical protein [Brevundimonas sp.]
MRHIIVFFALGFALLLGLSSLGRLLDDRPELADMRAGLARVEGRQAVSLGGSVARAVDFSALCLDGTEYFWNSQDTFEVAGMVDLMLARPSPPRLWFLVLAPTAQAYNNGAAASRSVEHRRNVHQLMLESGRLNPIDGDWRQAVVTAVTPALGFEAWSERIRVALYRLGLGKAPVRPVPWTLGPDTGLDPAQAAVDAVTSAESQADYLHSIAYRDAEVAARAGRALHRMNQRIRSRGGTLFIIVPPMTEPIRSQTNRRLGPEVAAFDRLLDGLAGEGVVVSRHWDDPDWADRFDLFYDNTHLNRAGAARFSRQLAAELRATGAIPVTECPAEPAAAGKGSR